MKKVSVIIPAYRCAATLRQAIDSALFQEVPLEILVLDEPTRNFSPLSGPVIRGILKEFPGCILSVSHDRKYIGQVCDTVYQLEPQGLVPVENQWR